MRALFLSCLALMACELRGGDAPQPTESRTDAISLGGLLTFGPAAVRTGPDTVDIFVPGMDFNVYTRRLTESERSFSGWAPIDGAAVAGSTLAAAADGAGGVKLFAMDRTVNGMKTMALTRTGGAWAIASTWRSLPYGTWMSRDAPGATVDADGVIHVFTSDAATHHLLHASCSTASNCNLAAPVWSTWNDEGVSIYSAPAPLFVSGELDVYFKGKDARVRRASLRDSGTWLGPMWFVADLGEALTMWDYPTDTSTRADYTVATAVDVDTHQGTHPVHNVSTNPSGTSAYTGSCAGAGAEAVMKLVLPQPARVQIDTAGAGYDTVLYLRHDNGISEVVDRLGVAACNDDTGGTTQSALDLALEARTYYLFLDAWGAGTGGGQQPVINIRISYINAPAAVVRHDSGVTLVDVYSVNTDNRLYVRTDNGTASTGFRLIEGPDPLGDGDLQNSHGVTAVQSSLVPGCSYVLGRAFPTPKLYVKGCGEAAMFSLDNLAGATFSTGDGEPVPTHPRGGYDFVWGQVNSAWNQTATLGAAATAADWSAVYFTARWPAELYLFDFDDHKTSWAGAWDPTGTLGWANVRGYAPGGGSWWAADTGAELVSKYVAMPGGVKAARLIDHGSCSTRVPWDDGLSYASTEHTGLLNVMQQQINDGMYLGAASELSGYASHWTARWPKNRYQPVFTHFAVDGVTANHSDGIAFQNHLVLDSGSIIADVQLDAHYTLGLEQGLPHLYLLSKNTLADSRLSLGYVGGLVFRFVFSPFGVGAPEVWSRLAALQAHGEPPCSTLDCRVQYDIPYEFTESVRAQATAIFGDPMAAASCTTAADCGSAPYDGDGTAPPWVCHNDRCMVAITSTMAGFSTTSPSSNFRTEFDTAGGPLAIMSCNPVEPGEALSSGSLGVCQTVLKNALTAHGVDAATATAWAFDPSMATNRQYGCVVPQRPNCGGDASFTTAAGYAGGYPCRDHATSEGGTGVIGPDSSVHGRCTWRPAFKRLNVLPRSLELVWSEANEPASASESIVKTLAPASACSTPVRSLTEDVSEATPLPRLIHED